MPLPEEPRRLAVSKAFHSAAPRPGRGIAIGTSGAAWFTAPPWIKCVVGPANSAFLLFCHVSPISKRCWLFPFPSAVEDPWRVQDGDP